MDEHGKRVAAQLYRSGLTLQEVGEHFGVSREAVRLWLRDIGVETRSKGRRASYIDLNLLESVRALREYGMSEAKIAHRLGVGKRTVSRARRDLGLPRLVEYVTNHGSTAVYARGCRCDDCRRANADRHHETRRSLRRRPRSEVPHGTVGGYGNWGCRCGLCKEAHSAALHEGRSSERWRRRNAGTCKRCGCPKLTSRAIICGGCRSELLGLGADRYRTEMLRLRSV